MTQTHNNATQSTIEDYRQYRLHKLTAVIAELSIWYHRQRLFLVLTRQKSKTNKKRCWHWVSTNSRNFINTFLVTEKQTKTKHNLLGIQNVKIMWPSFRLLSVSGTDSKLGLTMVRPSLQSAPESPVLDPPPVTKHVCQVCGNFLSF